MRTMFTIASLTVVGALSFATLYGMIFVVVNDALTLVK